VCVRARVRACVYEAQTKAASLNAVESDLLIEMTMDDPLFADFCLVAKQVTRCIKRQVSFKLSFNILFLHRRLLRQPSKKNRMTMIRL
jgi:hypothetical protein